MTPTQKYKQFFEDKVAPEIEDIKSVTLTDGDGIDLFLTSTVGNVDVYPALCLIRPRYRHTDNGSYGYYTYYEAIAYIFCKTQIEDYGTDDERERIEGDFNEAERIISDIARVIHQYNRADDVAVPIDFSLNDWNAEPVSLMSVDNCYGYEARFRIGLPTAEILNA